MNSLDVFVSDARSTRPAHVSDGTRTTDEQDSSSMCIEQLGRFISNLDSV